MNPAISVILFTTASGMGYGMLVLLAVFAVGGVLPQSRWFGLVAFALAFGAITFGLVASATHLGRPARMWRSFSQWRSSWLSREAILAVAVYVPGGRAPYPSSLLMGVVPARVAIRDPAGFREGSRGPRFRPEILR